MASPPGLDVCLDAQFDEIGGWQTRYPFGATGLLTSTGGSISVADCRKVIDYKGELLLFTKDTLYSWSQQLAA